MTSDLRSGHTAQHAKDLDVHGLRLDAFEHRVGDAVHAGLTWSSGMIWTLGSTAAEAASAVRQTRPDETMRRNMSSIPSLSRTAALLCRIGDPHCARQRRLIRA